MNWHDAALATAGVIGSGTAVAHGILTQRLMVGPLQESFRSDRKSSAVLKRLVPMLLHFSTIAWLLGGLALIAAATWLEQDARLATALSVGSLYLYGALGNFWATRTPHPGGVLMTAALILIAFGIS